jgi:hypothetical protein
MKIFMVFYNRNRKNIKICMETKRCWLVKVILREKNKTKDKLLDFKIYYKSMVIKTAWYWQIVCWNRITSPEINPHIAVNWSFTKVPRKHSRQRFFFQQLLLNKMAIHMNKAMLDPFLMPHTKIYSNVFKVLNVRFKTVNLCARTKHAEKASWQYLRIRHKSINDKG